ncbi:hypothetical protein OA954_04745 [Alphaproteobacteria bacterium]|nr:hypothetical protein [Alphaproteobacteria bacterium]
MNKIFGFTERSLNFWLSFLSKKEDSIINFCKVEYGNDWQWAYSQYQRNQSFPNNMKEAAL